MTIHMKVTPAPPRNDGVRGLGGVSTELAQQSRVGCVTIPVRERAISQTSWKFQNFN